MSMRTGVYWLQMSSIYLGLSAGLDILHRRHESRPHVCSSGRGPKACTHPLVRLELEFATWPFLEKRLDARDSVREASCMLQDVQYNCRLTRIKIAVLLAVAFLIKSPLCALHHPHLPP